MPKQKDIRRSDWKRILKRDYVWTRCRYQQTEGIASLIRIREITQPLTVRNGDHEVTIVDAGISWLQIAFREQFVWVTAMFDRDDRLLQVYFDLTNGNQLEPEENPTFEDMYLDMVMEPDGTLYVLDREELEAAFHDQVITAQQYKKTLAEGEKLYQWLTVHWEDFAAFCCEQRTTLKGMLENGEDAAR